MFKNKHKHNCEYIGFNDRWFMVFAIPLLALIMPALFLGLSWQESLAYFFQSVIPSVGFTALFWLGDRYIVILHRKRFPGIEQLKRRLVVQSIAIIIYTMLVAWVLRFVEDKIPNNPWAHAEGGYWKTFGSSIFITALVTTIYEAAYFINMWKQSIAANEKLKQENVTSQLEAMKNQVNPHFLFNSLNTLASIIPEDQNKAVEFVQKLSMVYRCILDLRDKTSFTLEEELMCTDNYIFLLKTRFEENLRFQISIEDSAKKKFVVPMSLQMLIENAVKHNVVSQRKPLVVSIRSENDELVISNPIHLKAQESEGTRVGLQNIDNRYRLTFGKEISVNETKENFEVRLPLLSIEEYESTHH
ncbi:MAG: histidine kinase [Flavobacteriales bacterium]|nr:histidine kinase [Flavobacteriales bacterium]